MKAKIAAAMGLGLLAAFPLTTALALDDMVTPPAVAAQPPVALSPAASDLVRLAQSGVSEEVLLAYVKNSQSRYALSADAILYLRDVGLSDAVVKEILDHDKPVLNQPVVASTNLTTNKFVYNQQPYGTGASLPPVAFQTATGPVPQVLPTTTVPAGNGPAPTYVTDAPADVNYFYQDLSPYGSWMNLDGYGWCWQPTTLIVNRQWRPYCDGGYWADTPAGWCWQSDYTWGWAPFHYGRWQFHDRAGWVWFPDRVWGPGWVTWRTEADHCGWAPLPFRAGFDVRTGLNFNGVSVAANFDFGLAPGLFTFIAIGDFTRHDYSHRRLSPLEVNRIYNRTTVINNRIGNGNIAAFNRGIPRERVEEVTHAKIKTLDIRNAPPGRGVARADAPGVVYRRELQAPASPVRPVAQKVDDHHPLIPQRAALPGVGARTYPTPAYTPNQPQPDARPGAGNNNFNRPPNSFNPNARQQAVSAQPSVPTPATPRATQIQPASPSRQPYAPGVGAGNVPVNSPFQAPPNMLQTRVSQPNNQVYYPKTYQQFNENRFAPAAAPSGPTPNVQAPSQSSNPAPDSQSTPANRPGDSGRGR